jgi:hypothetical protein
VFSDGSGALPRAMMLPRSKSRSATIFSTMRSMLIAMAMGAGGSWENYMEHYDMMDAAWLSNGCSDPNMEIISSGGRNSRWAQMTHAAEGIADGKQLEVDGADMLAWWNVPRVQVLGAYEKGKGFPHNCGVRVPAGEIFAEDDGVRGFMVDIKEKTPGEDMEVCLPGVQALRACETRVSGIEATEIQIHGSRQDGGLGACEMEFNLTKMQWCDDHGEQCIELATPHNSTWRKSFGPWKACVALVNTHIMDFFRELFVLMNDIVLSYNSISYATMGAAWMALVKVFMEKFMDLMTVNHMWCCWTVGLAACMLASHLGRAAGTSSRSRSKRKQLGVRRCQTRLQLKTCYLLHGLITAKQCKEVNKPFCKGCQR